MVARKTCIGSFAGVGRGVHTLSAVLARQNKVHGGCGIGKRVIQREIGNICGEFEFFGLGSVGDVNLTAQYMAIQLELRAALPKLQAQRLC